MKRTNDPTYQQKLFLVNLLKNRGYSAADLANPQVENIFDKEWKDAIEKLGELRHRISREDEDVIKSIINKY